MVEVLQIETPSLGDRSYLVHDGTAGLVIDPQRDIDRVTALAAGHGVHITHVAETHIHNDYLTGGLALARATGATYLVNEADPVGFSRTPVRDGDSTAVGSMRVRALATPGHTFTHLSYLVETPDGVAGVFTGGSLLYGATGRPDLLGPGHTGALARAQYASAQRLARELPGATQVFPTHGFGSFCAAKPEERGPVVHHWPREAGQSRADPGPGGLPGHAADGRGHLADVLRAHRPGEPGRAGHRGSVPAAAGRPGGDPPPHRSRRVGDRPA